MPVTGCAPGIRQNGLSARSRAGSRTRFSLDRLHGDFVLSEWAPAGEDRHVFGMVTLESRPRFLHQFAPVFNGGTFLDFLKEIVRRSRRKVFLVIDHGSCHNDALRSTFGTFQATPSLIANHVARFL